MSTLLAVEPPVSQWLERPNEFDSHLELGIFSEVSGIRILLLLNNGSVGVLTLDSSCLITGSQSHDCIQPAHILLCFSQLYPCLG